MPRGVYFRTEWHRDVVRKAMTGRQLSLEHRQHISDSLCAVMPAVKHKISAALKGKPKSSEHIEKVRMANIGQKRTYESREKMRQSHLGKRLSEFTKSKLSLARKHEWIEGRRSCTFTPETRAKVAEKARQRVGPLHPRWVADRSSLAARTLTRTTASLVWANAVKRRGGRKCFLRGKGDCLGRLEAHHIRSFKGYPELRYDVSNGITLCHAHHPHKKTEVIALAPVFESMVAAARKG